MNDQLSSPLHTICVYCGSSDGLRAEYLDAAFQMGQILAKSRLRIVYGAGSTGLMGAVAEGALQAGGWVTGVVPTYLNTPQLTHARLSELEVVETIQQRKARLSELADAFIALPGGYGTFEELFETLTWAQIGLHHKPVGLLNTYGYYDPVLALVQHARQEGFIYAEHHILLVSSADPQDLLKQICQYEFSSGPDRWISR